MNWQTRLFEFPGGVLEACGHGDESDDAPGIYLECQSGDREDYRLLGAGMRYKATALGYLRTDVSRISQLWDEAQMRRLASRLGYDFAGIVIYDPLSGRSPLARLKAQATRLDAEAVIVPSPEHFEDGQIPASLVRQLDVITVGPEETYARRAISPLSSRPPLDADGA